MTTGINFKRFSGIVSSANEAIKISGKTKKDYPLVTGISCYCTDPTAFVGAEFQTPLTINGEEVFPEGFQPKVIACSSSVKANDRFFDITTIGLFKGDDSDFTVILKDKGTAAVYPYTIDIYIRASK